MCPIVPVVPLVSGRWSGVPGQARALHYFRAKMFQHRFVTRLGASRAYLMGPMFLLGISIILLLLKTDSGILITLIKISITQSKLQTSDSRSIM